MEKFYFYARTFESNYFHELINEIPVSHKNKIILYAVVKIVHFIPQ